VVLPGFALGKVDQDRIGAGRQVATPTLDVALALLPAGAPPRRRHSGGWNNAQRKAGNLATRMRRNADQVLRLLDDTRVALTNSTAEGALGGPLSGEAMDLDRASGRDGQGGRVALEIVAGVLPPRPSRRLPLWGCGVGRAGDGHLHAGGIRRTT